MNDIIKQLFPDELSKKISLMEDSNVGLEDKLTRIIQQLIVHKGLNALKINYEPKRITKTDARIIALLSLYKELKGANK